MKKTLLFLIGILILFPINSTAQEQNFRTLILDSTANYFEIVNNERAFLKPLKTKTDKKSKKQIKQFERWAAFWKDRILPDGSFVSSAYNYSQWKIENKKIQNKFSKPSSIVNWAFVGPSTPPVSVESYYPGMGRVNTIAFNGSDTSILYIGSPSGGVWKSTDGGASWQPKGDDFPNMGVSDIVINPVDTDILYLATGDYDGMQNLSVGVLKSTDAGNTWNTTGLSFALTESNVIGNLLLDPNNVNTIFATTMNSIKRSTDAGVSWTDVISENGALFNDIVYKSGSSDIIYATSKAGKFYISVNNGATWSVASTPASARIDIALTADDADLIVLLDSNGVIKKSTNQGSTWTTITTIAGSGENFDSQGGYNMTIAISPIDKDLILVGGVHGWRSMDGGSTWEIYLDGYWESPNPYFYVHSDHHDMQFVPGTDIAFSGNDGGIFKGDAFLDAQWTDLSSGLAITQYYNVAGTPQNEGKTNCWCSRQ